jgi:dienelactone hydrolase
VILAALAFALPAPAFHVRTFQFVDHARGRTLETVVRYPTTPGPHPLVVFAHGFALTPAPYARLLDAWARAGYVVAAPLFPGERADRPGGPDESDLINEPRDISFVISSMLARGGIDRSRIAVAGHSDGAVAALAVAYDPRFADRRVRAAIVLAGALLGGMTGLERGPPLLAVQGTADRINPPGATAAYFRLAHRPKFLLWLLGAPHLPPYTDEQPQLGIVERSTLAFLAHYLDRRPLSAFTAAARRPGLTRLVADP